MIDLRWGENPLEPSKRVAEAVRKAAANTNRYGAGKLEKLEQKIAEYCGIGRENVLVVNGSDKSIRLCCQEFAEKKAACFWPSYSVLEESAEIFGAKVEKSALNEKFEADFGDLMEKSRGAGLAYVCNPNNPTGNVLGDEKEVGLLLESGAKVLVDECYFELSKRTMAKLAVEEEKLLVSRSFSKCFGLAGLRIGYLVGNAGTIGELKQTERTLELFGVASTSIAGALAALEEGAEKRVNEFEAEKNGFCRELKQIGLNPLESKTTFFLASLTNLGINGSGFRKEMEKRGVLLKDLSRYGTTLEKYAFFSVPERAERERVLETVETILSS